MYKEERKTVLFHIYCELPDLYRKELALHNYVLHELLPMKRTPGTGTTSGVALTCRVLNKKVDDRLYWLI